MTLLILTVKHKQALTVPHIVLTVAGAGETRLPTGRVIQRGEATHE